MTYDIIIIGAGAAGLYIAHKLHPLVSNMIILEMKDYVGGRTRMFEFHKQWIPSGAYGIDTDKNTLMVSLLKNVGMKITPNAGGLTYDHVKYVDIMAVMDELVTKLTPENSHWSTKHFMTTYLGATKYNDFVINASYGDFETACILDTLTHYGMEDNAGNHNFMGVQWNTLWETIAKNLQIEYNTLVSNIITKDNEYGVMTTDNIFYGKRIIVATDILSVKSLFPMLDIYNTIHTQPFIRIYGAFNEKGLSILKKYVKGRTLVSSPLQSIYPVAGNVYSIAYSDNANASLLSYYIADVKQNKSILEQIITESLGCPSLIHTLLDIVGYYKYPGTHYYTCDPNVSTFEERMAFIHKGQRPFPNIWVIGEVIGIHQGWVESAVQSAEAVLPDVIASL